MRPLWTWPSICWLLTGVPGYGVGVAFGYLAVHLGWWTDPEGVWATLVGFVGLALGAVVWMGLTARSYERVGGWGE